MVMTTGFSEFSECKLIEFDQDPYMAQISIADASVEEGDSGSGWMDFDVTLNRTATITVSVEYGMDDGSAQNGQDYNQSWGMITFPPGTTQQTISAEILGDTIEEPHETFTVTLHTPVGAQIQDSQAIGTILNDDGIAQLSIADASVDEGDSGSSWMDFDVTLNRTVNTTVSVEYDMVDDSAIDGQDYNRSSGMITFLPGTTQQTISAEILGDTTKEPHETFTVTLHTPVGAQIQDPQATGTILNDDGDAQLSIADASIEEGDSGSSWMDFDVTLNRTVNTTVSVEYDMVDNSAVDGQDYNRSSGTITFLPGTTQQTISVEILGDTTKEPHETFTVTLHTPVGAQIQDPQATGTSLNDDGAGGYDLFLPVVIR